jgi:hypothetical protein
MKLFLVLYGLVGLLVNHITKPSEIEYDIFGIELLENKIRRMLFSFTVGPCVLCFILIIEMIEIIIKKIADIIRYFSQYMV